MPRFLLRLLISLLLGCFMLLGMTACADADEARVPLGARREPRVLWLGTSIPAGCTYPAYASQAIGMKCTNNAIPASFLCLPRLEGGIMSHTGYSLTMTAEEMEQTFRPYVKSGKLKNATLKYWKSISYETLLLKELPGVDVVVIDHGFNDRDVISQDLQQRKEDVDWTSEDRTTFIGAFNYLYRQIREINPDAVVCIGGYFQRSCTMGYAAAGSEVATICEWIAGHYDLPLLDAWNYVDIPDGFIPNSAGYLDALNKKYGTDFRPKWTDTEGNITYFQRFCPDAIHPSSDPTGNSDSILNEVFARLLRERLLRLP